MRSPTSPTCSPRHSAPSSDSASSAGSAGSEADLLPCSPKVPRSEQGFGRERDLTGRARGPPSMGPMSGRILIIDDDERLAAMVAGYLEGAGFRVAAAPTAFEGQQRLKREQFDALILDLMLPDADGLEVCRRIRATSDVPILMLTARGDAMDRVVGLEIGADDYLPKPFEPRELLARLPAILRRKAAPATADVRRFGRLEIDRAGRRVTVDGE